MEALCFGADLAGRQDSVCKTPAQSLLLFQSNENNECHNEDQIQIKVVVKLTCTGSHLPVVPCAHYKYCMQLQLQSLKD